MFRSFVIAFSTFSRIPMPRVEWTKDGMKWSPCFLPFIGAVIGLLDLLAFWILHRLGFGMSLTAAVLTAMPVLITGGIHYDGFLDTSDAVHSWKPRNDKLDILKDPNAGAFAVICGLTYQIVLFGFFSEARFYMMPVIGCSYFLSRALSGLAMVTFPKARKDGMLRTNADAAHEGVPYVMLAEIVLVILLMIGIEPVIGCAAVSAAAVTFLIYRKMSDKVFGGITGDLAGWFIQMSEVLMLIAIILIDRIIR